ncbi:TRI35 protein, partial [Atractosteus spatula]|nr:TRI35 protein [Atractosteus spatula]
MAARSGSLEDEFSCPVCCEIFRDPVVLKCSHSFCKACLQQFWKTKPNRECPVCRRRSSLHNPPVSLVLKNVAECLVKEKSLNPAGKSQMMWNVHGEKLKLFCLDDEEALCFVCHTSKRHRRHKLCPIEEAALDFKEQLKVALDSLKNKLKHLYDVKQECDDTAHYMKAQAYQTVRQIKEEFDKLHKFLEDEEAARIVALRDEEERKSQMMRKKIQNITREILSLSHTIIAISDDIRANDESFLQNYKNTKSRAQHTFQDPEPVPRALIDVSKHLSCLKYKVWKKMLRIVQYTPVTLDPNMAYAWLTLSADLTSVSNSGEMQEVPDNPERFDHFVFVLGSEGFISGKPFWEVEVGDKIDWVLGVAKESVSRKGMISGSPEGGFWTVSFCAGDYIAMTTPRTQLTLKRKPWKIRVQLDYERGEVSFSDASHMTPIYTFKDKFTERMYPFFCPGANINGNNPGPLKICPVKVAAWNSNVW